ncbi:anti-sigma factor [Alterisphingorhabdus coralli]|uniref:Zinc-finger domain-containing protein n=1 Tax=Alterisphingorhabdus coralli TaxID=3071408 RepID=A0AA97I0U1_9SPHN|nr:hypothetical protein [Parasphingorhabdus sp. SCSIO 66989]WOE74688.1 hypothetical protein RB602_12655 [Parasphingorhabdus sp. SCSIO 66989]
MSITEEQLAAYADGELTGEEKSLVETAIADDPALARKVETHRALKEKLGAHFAPILDQPVPDRLTDLLATNDKGAADEEGADEEDGAEVISLASERQKRSLPPAMRRWFPVAGPALAASLVLAVWQPWQSATPDGYAEAQLASALDDQLVATQATDAETRILLSFENASGELCRAYRGSDAGGIACRDDTGWEIKQRFELSNGQNTEFRQAGSESDLLAAAQEMTAGDALDAEAEAEAREKGWR